MITLKQRKSPKRTPVTLSSLFRGQTFYSLERNEYFLCASIDYKLVLVSLYKGYNNYTICIPVEVFPLETLVPVDLEIAEVENA